MKMSKEDSKSISDLIATLDFITLMVVMKIMESKQSYTNFTAVLGFAIRAEKLNTEKAIQILQSLMHAKPGAESAWKKLDSEKILEFCNLVAKLEKIGPEYSVKDNTIDEESR